MLFGMAPISNSDETQSGMLERRKAKVRNGKETGTIGLNTVDAMRGKFN